MQNIIGARTNVVFPTDIGQTVPAKVDTGADYSSVWASDIREEDGVLSFVLFAPGSPYYSGKVHTSTDYEVTRVKNSFGTVEERYKTRLSLRIEGRRIRVTFSLADRSQNRYPILIGRKTLSGKFLVDTRLTFRENASSDMSVLMLNVSSAKYIQTFAQKLEQSTPGLKCDFSTYDDLMIFLSSEGAEIISLQTNEALKRYDLVYFKTRQRRQEFAGALSELFDMQSTQYIDREIQQHASNSKVTQYASLYRAGLPLPKTVMLAAGKLQGNYQRLRDFLGTPFILKDPEADKGLRNYLVNNEADYQHIIKETDVEQLYYVGQEFIPNNGDLRMVVLGRAVELVIGRKSSEDSDTHLNNTSVGGTATLLEVAHTDAQIKRMAVQAARALNRQVAGVDLIQDTRDGEWYVLEVNNSPQLASGAFVDEKVATFGAFLRRYASK